jgi:hypothetical protein
MVKKNGKKKIVIKLRNSKAAKKEEMTRLGSALRALGGLGGGALGSFIGQTNAGSSLGNSLGATISKWLGSGDYSISSNSIVNSMKSSGKIPMMHKDGQSVVIRHKEYLGEVRGHTSFLVRENFPINPGLEETFPWLCGIAQQYQEYKLRGMIYHYVPSSGNAIASTNPALGTVMLQTSYRASDSLPTSKLEMLNEYCSNESVPSDAFCHPIECNPRENPFEVQYVRSGAVPSNEDIKTYDLGQTFLAVSGQQVDDAVIGDLWVTYEIELRKPQLTHAISQQVTSYIGTSSGTISAANPFTSTLLTSEDTSMAGTLVATGNTITFGPGNAGTYLVTIIWTGATSFLMGTITTSNCTKYNYFGPTTSNRESSYTTGSTIAFEMDAFTITDPTQSAVVTFNTTTLTGATKVVVSVTELNPSTALSV